MTAPNATKPLPEVTVTVDGIGFLRMNELWYRLHADGKWPADGFDLVCEATLNRIAELEAQKAVLLAACRAAWPSHQSRYDRVGEQLWAAIERAKDA